MNPTMALPAISSSELNFQLDCLHMPERNMAARRYAEELRTIGQALQARGVTAFELHSVPAGYFIKELAGRSSSTQNRLLRFLKNSTESTTYGFELTEVQALSSAGRARRSATDQIPNFRDLSNLLRTIGAYMDSKQVELIELQKRPISISLAYRDKLGNEQREDRTVSSFHNVFREILMTRASTPR